MDQFTRFASWALLILLGAVTATWPVAAGATTLNTIQRGWYNAGDFNDPTNDNYIVGQLGNASPALQFHNFFSFDLTGVTGTVTAANLLLFEPQFGFTSPNASETFNVFIYGGNVATLNAGGTVAGTYSALDSGTLAGTVTVSTSNDGTFINVTLNAAALSALTSAEGGLFAFGGDLSGVPDGTDSLRDIFPGSDTGNAADGNTQLILTTSPVSSVPEPASLALLLPGLIGAAMMRRRRAS